MPAEIPTPYHYKLLRNSLGRKPEFTPAVTEQREEQKLIRVAGRKRLLETNNMTLEWAGETVATDEPNTRIIKASVPAGLKTPGYELERKITVNVDDGLHQTKETTLYANDMGSVERRVLLNVTEASKRPDIVSDPNNYYVKITKEDGKRAQNFDLLSAELIAGMLGVVLMLKNK